MEFSARQKVIAVGVLSAVGLAALGVTLRHSRHASSSNSCDDDFMGSGSGCGDDDYFVSNPKDGKKGDIQRLRRSSIDSTSTSASGSGLLSLSSSELGTSGSLSDRNLNSFNSSRLNVFNSSRLNEHLIVANDSTATLHDLSAAKLLPDNVSMIRFEKLLKLIRGRHESNPHSEYVMFDLRTMDWNGGHVVGSINVPDNLFYDQIPQLMRTYHATPRIIVQCMDSSLRSIENIEYYAKARKQLIKYYDANKQTSHYFQYTLKIQHEAHKTVLRSIQWSNKQWMKRFVVTKRVDIDFSDCPDMFANLKKQRLYLVAGGFFEFVNTLVNDNAIETDSMEFHDLVADFDSKCWEQLTVMGEKKLYHKQEYYTTRRSNPLRKTQTKREF